MIGEKAHFLSFSTQSRAPSCFSFSIVQRAVALAIRGACPFLDFTGECFSWITRGTRIRLLGQVGTEFRSNRCSGLTSASKFATAAGHARHRGAELRFSTAHPTGHSPAVLVEGPQCPVLDITIALSGCDEIEGHEVRGEHPFARTEGKEAIMLAANR